MPGWVRAITCRGDYSYGLYLYAFPVQQGIIALFGTTFLTNNVLIFIILKLILTTVFAIASWHLIEKLALTLKPERENPTQARWQG